MGAGPPTRARVIVHGLLAFGIIPLCETTRYQGSTIIFSHALIARLRKRSFRSSGAVRAFGGDKDERARSCRWHFKRQERI
jgi:hypothetical protein